MNYVKKIGLLASVSVLSLVFMAISASAQVRIGVRLGHRPRIVQRYYAPPVPYGYYGNPYWRNSDRYHDRRSIETARDRLIRDEYRYHSDGYISPSERRKLESDRYKLSRDRRRLRNDW